MTATQAGSIGGTVSAINSKLRRDDRILKYTLNPTAWCEHCNHPLPYQKRTQKFCNHSCRATYQNLARSKQITWTCKGCGKNTTSLPHKKKIYCDNNCQGLKITQDMLDKFVLGLISFRPTLKRLLIHKVGDYCFNCKLTEWQGVKIPLELHHVDGVDNNFQSNLQLLCPNCHALTPNWKGKNKGNGRKSKGLPTN